MERPHRFVFIANNAPSLALMFDDLRHDSRVDYFENPCRTLHSDLLRFIRRVHLSGITNSKVELPLKWIWGAALDGYQWDDGTEYYVIFRASAPYPINPRYFNELKKKRNNIKYILLPVDPYAKSNVARFYIEAMQFDYIFTYDASDARQYGFHYFDSLYSKFASDNYMNITTDLLYVAELKKGRNVVFDIFDHLSSHNLRLDFRLTKVARKEQRFRERIIYNRVIPYSAVIEKVRHSNCILEIMGSEYYGPTLRYFEAVCYNKKLLTNNRNVVKLPFYDPNYIHVFESVGSIDCDWVRERTPVDYGYDGRFSPTRLLDRICGLETES